MSWIARKIDQYNQRKEERAEYKSYSKMMNKVFDLGHKGKLKEMRELVLQQTMQEEVPAEYKYTMLGILANHYETIGAYETAAQLYDATLIWFLKEQRPYVENEGVGFVMERIYQCERPDLLQKWFAHYENQMDAETKRDWREKISLQS